MSDPFEAMKAKKAKILADAERDAAAVDADMRELEKAQGIAHKYGLTLTAVPVPRVISDRHLEAVLSSFGEDEPAYKKALFISEKAVREAGIPLELSVLYEACVQAKVPLAGKRPQSTLSAYLAHKASPLESIRRGVYWLRNMPRPRVSSGPAKDPTDTPTNGLYVDGKHVPDDWSPMMKAAAEMAWTEDEQKKG
jgi:hypothetical protein